MRFELWSNFKCNTSESRSVSDSDSCGIDRESREFPLTIMDVSSLADSFLSRLVLRSSMLLEPVSVRLEPDRSTLRISLDDEGGLLNRLLFVISGTGVCFSDVVPQVLRNLSRFSSGLLENLLDLVSKLLRGFHPGFDSLIDLLRLRFACPGLTEDTQEYLSLFVPVSVSDSSTGPLLLGLGLVSLVCTREYS